MAQPALNFPLYERAEALGVLDGESALIVAPTATGKSHIVARRSVVRSPAVPPARTSTSSRSPPSPPVLLREEPGRNRLFKEYVRLE